MASASSPMSQQELEDERMLLERVRLERKQIVARYDLGRDREGVNEIDDWEDPKFEIYHTQDRYGFIHDQRLPDRGRSEREQKQIKQERERSKKWAEMIKDEKKYFEPRARNREKMINRVYKGVPDSVRGTVWYIILEIDKIKREQPGTYQKMRSLARIYSPDIRQIDLDVNRTYRDHVMFRERYNLRQQALFHVLAAYSMYNTEVGYCQGMSQIAALLLMYLNEEEDVFWALSQLMVSPRYAMHGFFIQGFPKLIRFQAHHEKILKKFLPKLKKHLDKNGIDTGIYTLKWFFQCFLDRIPFSLTLRVWDLYLLEGERVMIGMAYNILRMHRRYLMKQGMDELIEHLQINLEKDFGYDDDTAIDKLRFLISELASNRLDSPGRPPPDELPQRPFGMVPQHLTLEQEIGYRTDLTEKEREFSMIQRQEAQSKMQRANNTSAVTEGDEEEDDGSDRSLDESSSLPDAVFNLSPSLAVTPVPLSAGGDSGNRGNRSMGRDNSSGRLTSSSSVASRPHSDAIDRLDDSVRLLLLQTAELNGCDDVPAEATGKSRNGRDLTHQRHHSSGSGKTSSSSSKRYSSSSLVTTTTTTIATKSTAANSAAAATSRNNGILSTSAYEERSSSSKRKTEKLSQQSRSEQKMVITKGDVVRIHVPYTPEPCNDEVTVTTTAKNRTVTSPVAAASPQKQGGSSSATPR